MWLCCRRTATTALCVVSSSSLPPSLSSTKPRITPIAGLMTGPVMRMGATHSSSTVRLASVHAAGFCSRRGMTATTDCGSHCRSAAAEAALVPAWKHLVCLLTSSSTHTQVTGGTPSSMDGVAVNHCRTASPVRLLWLENYHCVFSLHARESKLTSTADGASARQGDTAPLRTAPYVGLMPEEAEALPLFVQALGALGMALTSHMHHTTSAAPNAASRSSVSDTDALPLREVCVWLSEVQAVLLYVGRRQLWFVIPPRFSATAFALEAEALSPSPPLNVVLRGAEISTNDIPFSQTTTSESTTPVSALASTQDAGAHSTGYLQTHSAVPASPSLRLLARPPGYSRLRDTAPLLPYKELLRVVVLVEAARTILDVAQPPPLASTVRAKLYTVLLCVLGACEQLSPGVLASLTTCMARCVDSYATRQQLPPLDHTLTTFADTRATAVHEEDLCCDYRRVSWESTDAGGRGETGSRAVVHPSPLEEAEAAQLRERRGGLHTMVKPTEVLQQLAVLASDMQHRIARALRKVEANQKQWAADEDTAEHLDTPSSPWSTAHLAQAERIEEGMLGLLSLQQRKERQATQEMRRDSRKQRPPVKQRRTVAVIEAEARAAAAAKLQATEQGKPSPSTPSQTSSGTSPGGDASARSSPVADVTLSDVAEVCSALAAIGYRGSAGGGKEPLWSVVADFTCTEIDAVADARDDLNMWSEGVGGTAAAATAVSLETEKESAIEQLMWDVRDVVFALDRVGCSHGYDKVMTRLVRRAFLPSAIPAPSASVRAMRDYE